MTRNTPNPILLALLGAACAAGGPEPASDLIVLELASCGESAASTIQAESGMDASTGTGVTDGWNLWTNGTLSFDYDFGGESALVVIARGSQAGGVWPLMRVSVDGSALGDDVRVATSEWSEFRFELGSRTGRARVDIAFLNDSTTDGDRNLYVDRAELGCDGGCRGADYEADGDMSASTGASLGGGAWNLWTNGSLTFEHTFEGSEQLIVRAAGEPAGGVWPRMRVTVGGSAVGTVDVASSEVGEYAFDGFGAGRRTVGIEFTNDSLIDGDRNLLVHGASVVCAPACEETTYEGRAMTGSVGAAVSDGWMLWSNGSASFEHDFGAESRLVVSARGTQAAGAWPTMRVSVGGAVIGETSVSTSALSNHAFELPATTGRARVSVEFTNDYYDGTNDRNLVVGGVTLGCGATPTDPPPTGPAGSVVEAHGQLSISGSTVVDECGRPTQLRGMSYFWHQWDRSEEYWNDDVVQWLVDDWKVEILRGAVGIHSSGYFADPAGAEQRMRDLIEAAVAAGVYVIVDWHSHNIHEAEAVDFFTKIARDYGHHPNVIYEIFNEPDDESWSQIKQYSRRLIQAIRAEDPDNIIVVGTPFYSQNVDEAANDRIRTDAGGASVSNIAYTLHVYAGQHKQSVRDKANYALDQGIALWMTECGRTGVNWGPDNTIDASSFAAWEDWMDEHHISWTKWSLGTKNEVSSSLQPWASTSGGWSEGDLRPEGVWNRNRLRTLSRPHTLCR